MFLLLKHLSTFVMAAATMLTAIYLLSALVTAEALTYVPIINSTTRVWASSIYGDSVNGLFPPELAVNGNYDTAFSANSTFATENGDMHPYFDIYLEGLYEIQSVTITNRGDMNSERLHDINVLVYNANPLTSNEYPQLCNSIGSTAPAAGSNTTLSCLHNPTGYFIRIYKASMIDEDDLLQIVEVSAMGAIPFHCPQ